MKKEPKKLYSPFDNSSCGVACVANIHANKSHLIIREGLDLMKKEIG